MFQTKYFEFNMKTNVVGIFKELNVRNINKKVINILFLVLEFKTTGKTLKKHFNI